MKVIKIILLGVLIAITMFSFTSCTRKISFLTSSVVPAARGNVEISRDEKKNYLIHIKMSNLAEVERLQPQKKMYVVWIITEQNITSNVGHITSSPKKLTAELETVSPFKPVKVFITAEDDANAQYPGAALVLSTDKF